jgi:alkanesulfonate monooxygenase SsuD/methylene tetrahydromethanopterin reductase-like flavin-dependent oxidoreductase (luciferase family)
MGADEERSRVGVVFGSLTPPEALAAGARRAEGLGFGELWFSEDCFFTGGLSGLAGLLGATSRVPAGLGLASVVTRHPAILAMEVAGLARAHPGRVRAAVGLGSRGWLEQMGLLPGRPLTAVTATLDVLRALLAGEAVEGTAGPHVLHDVRLAFPPDVPPELWVGAVGEGALRAAGARADGVLLSVLAGADYVTWAAGRVAAGAVGAAGPVPPVTAYVLAAVDDEPAAARDAVREAVGFFLRAEAHSALVGRSRHGEAVRARVAALAPGEPLDVEDAWVDEFAVAGTPGMVADGLGRLLDAGAASLGLWLFPPDRLDDQLTRLPADVLPALR